MIASSALTPEEEEIVPACDGKYLAGPRVAVNLRNGLVSDPDTGKAIDAPEAGLLARSLISAVREARLRLREEVDARCGDSERP